MKTYLVKIQLRGDVAYTVTLVTAKSKKAAIEKTWEYLEEIDEGYYAQFSSQALIIDTWV